MVEEAAYFFGNQLRVIQKQADSGQKPSGCDQLQGYRVNIVGSPIEVANIEAVCDGGPINTNLIDISAQHPGVIFEDNFTVKFRTVSQPVELSDGEVEIADVRGTFTYLITVDSGGAITIKEVIP